MTDVDDIIVPILRQIGCKFKNDDISIANFSAEDIYHSVAVSLRAIDKDKKFNTKLPSSKAARFRLTTMISSELSNMGYTATKIGYDFFLYPNEKDMRILLMWLVNKLPKQEELSTCGTVISLQVSIFKTGFE